MAVLHFKGKTAVENYHFTVPHHRLEFDRTLSILEEGREPGPDGNLIIEGDSLLSLKALLPTHAGRVKCVYVDPPYNTGNEGWVVGDNHAQPQFKDWFDHVVGKEVEDPYHHDKWCCMMYPRLRIMKELLSETGAILVSIDDHELHHLRMLMDEIFGRANFVTTISWKARDTDPTAKSMLSVDHEYVVVYTMNRAPLRGRALKPSEFSNPDNDSRGPYATDSLVGNATAEERPNRHFAIDNPQTGDTWSPDPARGWITDKKGFLALAKDGLIAWPADPKAGKPRKKRFQSEMGPRTSASSVWPEPIAACATDEVERILGERLFASAKPLELMTRLVDLACDVDDIVLDATAGSGTTAHAVLLLNTQDGGRRRFVLIQQRHETKEHQRNQFNVCEKVTAERVARAIYGYEPVIAKRKLERVEGLGGAYSYAVLGPTVFEEYREDRPPPFEELARYVLYTETSQQVDPKALNANTGRIGEYRGIAYYLLYTPNGKDDAALDLGWLRDIGKKENCRQLVVYSEKIWLHGDDQSKWERESSRTVRPMPVPFNLK